MEIPSKKRQFDRWCKLKQPNLEKLKCYLCDYDDYISTYHILKANDIFQAGEIIRYKCPNCDLIFGDLRFLKMSEKEIHDDHADTYSYYSEGATEQYILTALNKFDYLMDKSKSYLDYACGVGSAVTILRNDGYNIIGYDKYVHVENKFIVNNLNDLKFNVIYSNNFIEHLINPIEQIKEILNHLDDDGFLVFISDAMDEYRIEYTHFHTFYYTGKSFDLLCKLLDLKIVDIFNFGNYKIKILKRLDFENKTH